MKKTGKVLSLVLSAALVVSSLSATFASAATATKTEYVPVQTSLVETDLVNGKSGAASKTEITSTVPFQIPNGITTKDHLDVGNLTAADIAYKSGSNILSLSIDKDNSKVYAQLSSDSVTGSEVVAVRYTGNSYRYTDPTQPIQFSAEVDYTIKVFANNSVVISGSASAPVALTSLNKNDATGTVNAYVLKVGRGTGSIASFGAVNVTTSTSASADVVDSTISSTQVTAGMYFVKAANSNKVACTTASATEASVNLTKNPANSEFFNVGSLVVYAVPLKWDATNTKAVLDSANTISTATTVNNTVSLPSSANEIKMWHGSTYAMQSSEASGVTETVAGVKIAGTNVALPVADAINVTGANIIIHGPVTMDNGSVGTVSGTGVFTLSNGNVTGIDDPATGLLMSNGNVGSIAHAAGVTINGGVVGSVSATSVNVDSVDGKIPTTVGNITATSVDVKSTNAVKTGNIKAINADGTVTAGPASDSNSITVEGNSATVGTIDLDHYAVTINLTGFTGSIAAPLNAENGIIATPDDSNNNKANATVTGNVVVNEVNVADGTLTIANSLNVGTVTGAGTLVIPAGGMYVNNTMNSVSLKLSNASITTGMTAFSAAAYKVYDGMFKTVGFTLDYDAVSAVTGTRTTDTFKVKTVNFAGLTIAPVSGTSNKVVLNNTASFKVSAYPSGTSLPDNTKVDFSFSGSSDNFSYKTTADTITISALKYDDLFSSLNKGTITATLVDATTDTPIYQYSPVTYDVQMLKTPDVTYTSDTHVNVPVAMDGTYIYKITSLDGKEHAITNGSSSFKVTKTQSGNVYFYTITPVGKVGESCGMYIDGKLLDVATITAAKAKIDTAKVTVAVGKTYQFKVTAPTKPTFGVGSSAVKVIASSSKGSNEYDFKVQVVSGKTGDAVGIYVNGTRMSILTIG